MSNHNLGTTTSIEREPNTGSSNGFKRDRINLFLDLYLTTYNCKYLIRAKELLASEHL